MPSCSILLPPYTPQEIVTVVCSLIDPLWDENFIIQISGTSNADCEIIQAAGFKARCFEQAPPTIRDLALSQTFKEFIPRNKKAYSSKELLLLAVVHRVLLGFDLKHPGTMFLTYGSHFPANYAKDIARAFRIPTFDLKSSATISTLRESLSNAQSSGVPSTEDPPLPKREVPAKPDPEDAKPTTTSSKPTSSSPAKSSTRGRRSSKSSADPGTDPTPPNLEVPSPPTTDPVSKRRVKASPKPVLPSQDPSAQKDSPPRSTRRRVAK